MSAESLGIYNPNSGKGLATQASFAAAGIHNAIPFKEFISNPWQHIDSGGQKVIVGGGDGTNFSVLQFFAEHGDPAAVFFFLLIGAGSENVITAETGTTITKKFPTTTIEQFLQGKLHTQQIQPFSFATADSSDSNFEKTHLAFWSLNGGVFANRVLDYLARERTNKNIYLRNFWATMTALQAHWFADSYATAQADSTITGRDLVFLRNQLPLWSKKINAADLCNPASEKNDDYMLRIGRTDQEKAQAFAGFAFDMLMILCGLQPRTGTIHAVPVTERQFAMTFPDRRVAVDSELRQLSSNQVLINRQPIQKLPHLELAYNRFK